MKLRLPGRRTSDDTTSPSTTEASAEQLVKGAGKGRPTPKRSEAQGRRQGPPPPPPTTRKEAYRRIREQRASQRPEARAAMLRGDDSYLPARDRGPVRKYVRDIVDARRSVGNFFLGIAVIALIGTFVPNLAVRSYATFLLMAYLLLLIADSVFLGRRIKRKVADRFDDGKHSTRGVVWYGISRSTMVRRWRFPKPEVEIGADV